MNTSRRQVFRLAVVAIAMAGTTLTSSTALATDESETTQEQSISDPVPDDSKPADPLVIELIVESPPPPSETIDDQSGEEAGTTPADDQTADEVVTEDPVTEEAVTTEEHVGVESPAIAPFVAMTGSAIVAEEPAMEEPPDHEEDTGHEGGSGGMGKKNPYRMTFTVSWRFADGTSIPDLDNVLPEDWRTRFDLAAQSETGIGESTTAHCAYPAGGNNLVCEFLNGNHPDITDGMVVPAKAPAEYSVEVLWAQSGWTIDGARADDYDARALCPRGGGSHEGGDGHEGEESAQATVEAESEGSAFYCEHLVVIQQVAVVSEPPVPPPPVSEPPVPPPASEPPVPAPPASEPPPAVVSETPVVQPPATETVAVQTPVTEVRVVTPQALPATGNAATTSLLFGLLLSGLGLGLLLVTRRRPRAIQ